MSIRGTEDIIDALRVLTKKLATFEATGEGITCRELDLAEDLANWYENTGRWLAAERAGERAATTPVEIDKYTVSVKWGGKDGKWRWLAEASDGQARAGEDRMLVGALSAATQAAVDFPKVSPS